MMAMTLPFEISSLPPHAAGQLQLMLPFDNSLLPVHFFVPG